MTVTGDNYAFKDPAEMGEVCPPRSEVPLDVWRQVLDVSTGKPTGYVKRERMRTLGEVARDLIRKLDLDVCEKCGHERPRKSGAALCQEHSGCGGEYQWFLDEYFHGPHGDAEARRPVPHDWRWIACYPVTGGNEGHYVHVQLVCLPSGVIPEGEPNVRMVRLALGKTFRGMGHAALIANRCAKLLGA